MTATTRLELITPAKAQKWLDERSNNRPLSEMYSKKIADSINAGEWEVNGETLKFDTANKLIDGQHRCLAVVITQQSIKSFVTRGLNDCTFDTIDIGKKRTIGAIYSKNGEVNANALAAAIAWLWRYKNGYIKEGRWANPRTKESISLLHANEEMRESVHFIGKHSKMIPPSIAVCLHFLFRKKSREDADVFFARLFDGDGITKGNHTSGILLLKNTLTANMASTRERFAPTYTWAITVKAWNAFHGRKVLKSLRFSPGTEEFPVIE